jgi:hypothetical protein
MIKKLMLKKSSLNLVAYVRRRGDRPPPSSGVVSLSILENMERQGILVFYQWKNGMGVVT